MSGRTIRRWSWPRSADRVGAFARAWHHDYEVGKLGGPVDRNEWHMNPQTVNAYYNPEMNEIVFPAAILQPPFFTMSADDAVNYGAIGAVIGRDLPRLRRPRLAVRRRGQLAQLVVGLRSRGLLRPHAGSDRAVRRVRAGSRSHAERRAHARGEHRGRLRSGSRLPRVSALAGRRAGAGHRRLDR